METVEQMLRAGIERVILGTAALEDPQFVEQACRKFHESIIVSIDARQGYLATRGWRRDTGRKAVELAQFMVGIGVGRFIYTDIDRDGTLTEPNFSATAELINSVRAPVIAAGGISSINHIKMLKSLGAEGAIVGKALYTEGINLKQAIAALSL